MKLTLVITLCCLMCWVNGQNCITFIGKQCTLCVQKMHVYNGKCVNDIANCKSYHNNEQQCIQCKDGFKLQNNICISTVSIQAQYNSLKFTQISYIDALMDINYIIGINYVTNQIKQLRDSSPIRIFAQEGYLTNKLTMIRYVVEFEVVDKDNSKLIYQVLMKVTAINGKVTIDSFKLKQSTILSSNSIKNTTTTTIKTSPSISQVQLANKSNYKDITIETSQHSDLYLLIFLDNITKNINKTLQQLGMKSNKNQVIYIGKLDSNDFIYYWVEIRVLLVENIYRVFKTRGLQNKVTYQVKIIQFVEDNGNSNIQGNITNNNTNNITQTQLPTIVNVQIRDNKQSLNQLNNLSTTTTKTTNSITNTNTNTNTQTTVTATNSNITNTSTTTSSSSTLPQTNQPSTNTPLTSTNTSISTSTSQSSSSQPFKSIIYQQLNQTLLTKTSGYQQIDSKLFNKDQPIILITQKLLNSRPNKTSIKLYKAFLKNYALKAQYKLFFIDQNINAPNVVVYQGFATYDFLKKRVYVISFGQILN